MKDRCPKLTPTPNQKQTKEKINTLSGIFTNMTTDCTKNEAVYQKHPQNSTQLQV